MESENRINISLDLESLAFYDYELFAVVNHAGQLNTGHYTNFARSQSEVCSTQVIVNLCANYSPQVVSI